MVLRFFIKIKMGLTEFQLHKLFNTFLKPDGEGGFKVKVDMAFAGGNNSNATEETQLLVKAAVQAIAGKNFATETTLQAFLSANHNDLSAHISSEHTDLSLILAKLIPNPATETSLAALLAANHIDLLAIKSSIDALGIEHTTYSVVIRNLTIASLATDFISISGSATKTIKINEIQFSATATSAQVKDLIILKRKTLNTGGTSTLCNPIALDSNSPVCTAIVKAYTVNPTTLGTLIGEVRVAKYQFNSSNSLPDYIEYKFNENNNQHLTLRGVNESVSLNLNAQTVKGANVDCYIEFDEY